MKKWLIALLLLSSLTLSSCWLNEEKPSTNTSTSQAQKEEKKSTSGSTSQETTPQLSGGSTPEEAAKEFMNNAYACNLKKAFSYIKDGDKQLTLQEETYAKWLQAAEATNNWAKELVNELWKKDERKSEQAKEIQNNLDMYQKLLPKTLEEACKSVQEEYKDHSFQIDAVSKKWDDAATLTVTLKEKGKSKTDTLETVKINNRWFMEYKEIIVDSESSDTSKTISGSTISSEKEDKEVDEESDS